MQKLHLKIVACLTLGVAGTYGCAQFYHTASATSGAPGSLSKRSGPAIPKNIHFSPAVILDLPAAVEQNLVQVEFNGNGRDKMRISVTNKSENHVRLHVPAGLILQNNASSIVITRERNMDLKSGEFKQGDLHSAAISSTNQVVNADYTLTLQHEPKLDALLKHLEQHGEISPGAVQTATLALTENLPVSAFAKFTQAGSDLPSKYDTSAFRVEVCDIISALTVLRDIGVPSEQLSLTIDPQLKIEAMIDPLAHAAAMRYYGIAPQKEWDFWKHYLLEGDQSTRHYALYGIARFYPDVALQMLPQWARETKTNPAYRISAVQALAETQRIEAVSVLRQIEHEFGALSEIGKAARLAADVLDARLNKSSTDKVAFRATTGDLSRL